MKNNVRVKLAFILKHVYPGNANLIFEALACLLTGEFNMYYKKIDEIQKEGSVALTQNSHEGIGVYAYAGGYAGGYAGLVAYANIPTGSTAPLADSPSTSSVRPIGPPVIQGDQSLSMFSDLIKYFNPFNRTPQSERVQAFKEELEVVYNHRVTQGAGELFRRAEKQFLEKRIVEGRRAEARLVEEIWKRKLYLNVSKDLEETVCGKIEVDIYGPPRLTMGILLLLIMIAIFVDPILVKRLAGDHVEESRLEEIRSAEDGEDEPPIEMFNFLNRVLEMENLGRLPESSAPMPFSTALQRRAPPIALAPSLPPDPLFNKDREDVLTAVLTNEIAALEKPSYLYIPASGISYLGYNPARRELLEARRRHQHARQSRTNGPTHSTRIQVPDRYGQLRHLPTNPKPLKDKYGAVQFRKPEAMVAGWKMMFGGFEGDDIYFTNDISTILTDWRRRYDDDKRQYYYYNTRTMVTTWDVLQVEGNYQREIFKSDGKYSVPNNSRLGAIHVDDPGHELVRVTPNYRASANIIQKEVREKMTRRRKAEVAEATLQARKERAMRRVAAAGAERRRKEAEADAS